MLVLVRKHGESLYIGDDIKITILSNQHGGRSVKVGIEAPADLHILREELMEENELRKWVTN